MNSMNWSSYTRCVFLEEKSTSPVDRRVTLNQKDGSLPPEVISIELHLGVTHRAWLTIEFEIAFPGVRLCLWAWNKSLREYKPRRVR
jgi:hypothetical protein